MTSTIPPGWKKLAWNGISVSIPDNWEVGKIGTQYLVLEAHARPVMELKWRKIKGVFSHRKHQKQLARLYNKRLNRKISTGPLLPEWEKILHRFDSAGFEWQDGDIAGSGAIIYCSVCRTATLIQFYRYAGANTSQHTKKILTSFTDHRQDDDLIWSIYDIHAVIPAKYKLQTYRFDPGSFQLFFASKNQTVSLYRWGPAAVLLSGKGLLQFVQKRQLVPESSEWIDISDKKINGIVTQESNKRPRLNRFRPKPVHQTFRFWHLEQQNRILGLRITGPKVVDAHFFETLCGNYECL